MLCQHPVADKGNEITTIPTLLDMLELPGAVVSIDAIGCQKSIAGKIVQKKADYVLALKDNHPQLFEDVKLWLDSELDAELLTIHETLEKDHSAANLALIRRIALNLLRNTENSKRSIRQRKMRACFNDVYPL